MDPSQTTFPTISELPLVQSSEKWAWTLVETSTREFWSGVDEEGQKWLVKMRGSFYALRERTFSVIAQNLGISCQSSTFLQLSSGSEPLKCIPGAAPEQLATWFLSEHVIGSCGDKCPLRASNEAFAAASDKVTSLKQSPILNAVDWVRGEILGYLCDMHEPPGKLVTTEHAFVQIDNEQMFTNAVADLWQCHWLETNENDWSETGFEEARNLCEAVAELPDAVIAQATDIPPDYAIEMLWDVPRQAGRIRDKAVSFLTDLKSIFGS